MEPPEPWEQTNPHSPRISCRSWWKGYIEDFGSMIRLQIHPASRFFQHGVLFQIRPFKCSWLSHFLAHLFDLSLCHVYRTLCIARIVPFENWEWFEPWFSSQNIRRWWEQHPSEMPMFVESHMRKLVESKVLRKSNPTFSGRKKT
jgi:hypothetical protein